VDKTFLNSHRKKNGLKIKKREFLYYYKICLKIETMQSGEINNVKHNKHILIVFNYVLNASFVLCLLEWNKII